MLNASIRDAQLLVNVTNDAWFGHSGARYQHLQIARMLALESRRYLLRAANDGVSAVIDPYGIVKQQAREFTPAVLRGAITPRSGNTPYLLLGNWLVIGAVSAVLALAAIARYLKKRAGGAI
jgi:apolipoprotein N-acyltransferase